MDPASGRFITLDSFVGLSFEPQTLHKYLYVNQNPQNLIDPSGNFGLASIGFSFSMRSILISMAISIPFHALEAAQDIAAGADIGAVTAELVSNVLFDVAAGGAIGNLFRFARSFVKIRPLSQSISKFISARNSSSVWGLGWGARGAAIEKMIIPNRWLPFNYKVIDDYARGVMTSIKSIDLTAATYRTGGGLRSRILSDAAKLAAFDGGKQLVGQPIKKRVLLVAMESGAADRIQAKALKEISKELKSIYGKNLELSFQWIP
jgi:hypothetical protein